MVQVPRRNLTIRQFLSTFRGPYDYLSPTTCLQVRCSVEGTACLAYVLVPQV